MCQKWRLALPDGLCAGDNKLPRVRRLVSPDYSIVCDGRNQFECIALHVDAVRIEGVEPGGLTITDRIESDGAECCRRSVSIVAATVQIRGRTCDVVNARAENRDPACRLGAIRQIFEANHLVREPDAMVAGDLNMDPWREDDASAHYRRQQVGQTGERGHVYHSGSAEK